MNDSKIKTIRRDMQDTLSALERLESVGGALPGGEDSRIAAVRTERLEEITKLERALHAARGELKNARRAWTREKEELEKRVRELKKLNASGAAAGRRSAELKTEREAFEREKRRQLGEIAEIRRASPGWQGIKAALEAELGKAEERLGDAHVRFRAGQEAWENEKRILLQEIEEISADRKILKKTNTELFERMKDAEERLRAESGVESKLIQDKAGLEARLRGDKQAVLAELSQSRKSLGEAEDEVKRLKAQVEKLQKEAPGPPAGGPASGDALSAGIPTVDPMLEPAWARILETLHRPVLSAYAHLRRLAAARLAAGHRALIRLAAGEIVEAQDHMKVLSRFFDAGAESAENAPIQKTLESALMAWEPALRRRGILVARRIAPGLSDVLHHPETLRVAFYQVLRNAYEAMPRGGTLSITAESEAKSDEVVIRFQDTGPGFSPEALAGLFVPFATTRRGHLGIGLALLRRTVRPLGGDADAANIKEGGALITVRLPASRGELPSLSENLLVPEGPGGPALPPPLGSA